MDSTFPIGDWFFTLDGERLGEPELQDLQLIRATFEPDGQVRNGYLRLDRALDKPEPPYNFRGYWSWDDEKEIISLKGEMTPIFRKEWQEVVFSFQITGGLRDGSKRHLEAEMTTAPFHLAERKSPWMIGPAEEGT
jgi:hypothetical protein